MKNNNYNIIIIKKAEEDHNSLLKKITALDLEVDKASEQLADVTTKLEAANKQSADVHSNSIRILKIFLILLNSSSLCSLNWKFQPYNVVSF